MEKQVDFGAAMKPKTKVKSKFLTPADHPYDLVPIKHKIMLYSKEIDKMVEEADALQITNDAQNEMAVSLGTQAKKLWKQIQAVIKSYTDEPNQFVKDVRDFGKMFQDRLIKIEATSKKKVTDWTYHQELERREQERKAREEAEKLQTKLDKEAKKKGVEPIKVPEMVMPESPKVTRTETGASHQRMHWTFEVIDVEKVPREYLIPDEKKLRQAVAMGLREIPGVKIFEKATTVFRT